MTIRDLTPGMEIFLGPCQISREEIISFAREFDQAPFHLDEEAAKNSILGGLCASGWQTCSIALRMMHDSFLQKTNYIGEQSMEDCRWLKPVYVDDVLTGTAKLIKTTQNNDRLFATFDYQLQNQNNNAVLTMKHTSILKYDKVLND